VGISTRAWFNAHVEAFTEHAHIDTGGMMVIPSIPFKSTRLYGKLLTAAMCNAPDQVRLYNPCMAIEPEKYSLSYHPTEIVIYLGGPQDLPWHADVNPTRPTYDDGGVCFEFFNDHKVRVDIGYASKEWYAEHCSSKCLPLGLFTREALFVSNADILHTALVQHGDSTTRLASRIFALSPDDVPLPRYLTSDSYAWVYLGRPTDIVLDRPHVQRSMHWWSGSKYRQDPNFPRVGKSPVPILNKR